MGKKRRRTLGRYDSPEYIDVIKKNFIENFPNNVPRDFIIDHTIKYFWRYVENQLLQEKTVHIFSFGKFYLESRISPKTGTFQYYPKFKFSRHFNLRLRNQKGTATESEKREIEAKKEFMKNIWEHRRNHMLEKRGRLPNKFIEYSDKPDESNNDNEAPNQTS